MFVSRLELPYLSNKKISVIWCLFVCVLVSRLELPYLSRFCDYKGSTGLYITAGHKQLATIFVVLCIRLPDIEGDLERKLIGRRGGNKIRMDASCGIGDRMNQQKQTLEERYFGREIPSSPK